MGRRERPRTASLRRRRRRTRSDALSACTVVVIAVMSVGGVGSCMGLPGLGLAVPSLLPFVHWQLLPVRLKGCLLPSVVRLLTWARSRRSRVLLYGQRQVQTLLVTPIFLYRVRPPQFWVAQISAAGLQR